MNASLIDLIPGATKKVRYYGSGVEIFREGEAPQGVHFIRRGVVNLSFAARKGAVSPLRTAGPGEILGLSAVVSRHASECSATATTRCGIVFVESADLLRILEETPGAWLAVAYLLSHDVNNSFDHLRAVAV